MIHSCFFNETEVSVIPILPHDVYEAITMLTFLKSAFRFGRNTPTTQVEMTPDMKWQARDLERNMHNRWDLARSFDVYRHDIRAEYDELADAYMSLCAGSTYMAEAISFFASLPDRRCLHALIDKASIQDIITGLRPSSNIHNLTAEHMIKLLKQLMAKGVTCFALDRELRLLDIAARWDNDELFDLGVAWGEIGICIYTANNTDIVAAIEHPKLPCRSAIGKLLTSASRDPKCAPALALMADGYQNLPIKTVMALEAIGVEPRQQHAQEVKERLSASKLSSHVRLRCETRQLTLDEILRIDPNDLEPVGA